MSTTSDQDTGLTVSIELTTRTPRPSLNRRVLMSILAFNAEAPGLAQDVVLCFSPGVALSCDDNGQLACVLDVQNTLDRLHPGWDEGLGYDEAVAAVEVGLRFFARVERYRLHLLRSRLAVAGVSINPAILERWWSPRDVANEQVH